MSFMSTAPRPQMQSVADLRRERVDLPVGGMGRHDVEMPVHDEPRAAGVSALQPHHDRRTPRAALHELRSQADLVQRGHDVFGCRSLAIAAVVARVDRRDPDEVAADLGDLVLGTHRWLG
jgi:hypothetical protein